MWKLKCDHGRQVWHYDEKEKVDSQLLDEIKNFDPKVNKNSADRIYRYQALKNNFKEQEWPADVAKPNSNDPLANESTLAAFRGINFYQALQDEDGHWPGDYGGPMFLMPGLIYACYVTKTPLPDTHYREMTRYLLNHQHEDGGWGLHIECNSTMFGTVLNYIALRLMGLNKDAPQAVRARNWIKEHGGAVYTPSWGKFWLSVLGVFDWSGNNSLCPEMWLLPTWLPMHPSRFWCHCRMVYLPMSYLFGVRFTGPITPLILSLREEIYVEPYDQIAWHKYRNEVLSIDRYVNTSKVYTTLSAVLNVYENCPVRLIRKKALDFVIDYIHGEDNQTNHIDIGPVNKVINMICVYHADGVDSTNFKKHVDRLYDYLWIAEDGMKMQGYNGSQLWDTSFAVQAIYDSGLSPLFTSCLRRAYHYIDISQVQEDTPNREQFFRHISKGAWPFSTRDHGWPISDCTAEGLKATLSLHCSNLLSKSQQNISVSRLEDAVNMILSYQNKDGGWATYENQRGSPYLELLNPSEVFGDIIIDYSYVECTSTCIQALRAFQKTYPNHRREEINHAIHWAVKFLKTKQRPDGSWYGSWAVCFCYASWFGIWGLLSAGDAPESPIILRACEFLISKQLPDGGWGESYEASVKKQYVQPKHSLVVNTSWALLALMRARYHDTEAVARGIKFLLSKQKSNGDWDQEAISGVFNGNCMITYTAYRNVFPIWALGVYANEYAQYRLVSDLLAPVQQRLAAAAAVGDESVDNSNSNNSNGVHQRKK